MEKTEKMGAMAGRWMQWGQLTQNLQMQFVIQSKGHALQIFSTIRGGSSHYEEFTSASCVKGCHVLSHIILLGYEVCKYGASEAQQVQTISSRPHSDKDLSRVLGWRSPGSHPHLLVSEGSQFTLAAEGEAWVTSHVFWILHWEVEI